MSNHCASPRWRRSSSQDCATSAAMHHTLLGYPMLVVASHVLEGQLPCEIRIAQAGPVNRRFRGQREKTCGCSFYDRDAARGVVDETISGAADDPIVERGMAHEPNDQKIEGLLTTKLHDR